MRVLDVSFVTFGAPGLGAILEMTKLRSLELQGNSIWEAETRALPRLVALQRLNLYGARVDGAALAKLERLRVLLVKDTKLTAAGLAAIAELPELIELDVRGGDVGSAFDRLSRARRLARVWLSDTRVTDGALEAVASRVPLVEASLANCGLGARHCAGLAHASDIQRIEISFNADIGDAIASLGKLCSVRVLHAKGCEITNKSVPSLVASPLLQDLALDGNPINDDAVPTFRTADCLRQLGVSETKITKTGLRELRSSLPNCNVVA